MASLPVTSPSDGKLLKTLEIDSAATLSTKIENASAAQRLWARAPHAQRVALVEAYANALKASRETLGKLITDEAGKTVKEGLAEADSSADILLKTIKDIALPEFNGMLRRKERDPLGVVGLITSFNFPLVVAHWSIAPALLAGNSVVWKPSEKTPLVALAAKEIFDSIAGPLKDLLQVTIGTREIGQALVAHESIAIISATGSVGMGKGIDATLEKRKTRPAPSILELGGNNGAIITEKCSPALLNLAVNGILSSFLATTGQRCTNTRRVIVHRTHYKEVVRLFREKLDSFTGSGAIVNPLGGASNEFGYGALIDADAFAIFERSKSEAREQGGEIFGGARILSQEYPDAYYVEPALVLMPMQTEVMHKETFAPLLYMTPYDGDVETACAILNSPENAGLVSAVYTQSQGEADRFAQASLAGHVLINSPRGTGTPAYGMGFGGNRDSGIGEILNTPDPLAAFSSPRHFRRIAQFKDVPMND